MPPAPLVPRRPWAVMGVVNVTPDSFSDGGRWLDPAAAIAHGRELADEGAAILDVGGESTRPGAEPVGEAEELRRVVPVVEGLAGAAEAAISVDTTKAAVARAALDAGARYVNDVSALRADPALAAVIAEAGCDCCLMHMQGSPRTMQEHPRYEDVVGEVAAFLAERVAFALGEGIARGAHPGRSGDRVRQDARAQPRAAAAAGRDRRARVPGRLRGLAQVVPGAHHRPRGRLRACRGDGGGQRPGLRARRVGVPRP